MIKIANIRLGLATNSSSSHSIVIIPADDPGLKASSGWDSYEFGWEHFVLRSPEDKMRYLVAQLYSQLEQEYGEQFASVIIREWVSPDIEDDDLLDFSGYVDHQSSMTFPHDAQTKQINLEFIRDFRKYLEREDVMVLGGNDNDDTPDEWVKYRKGPMMPLPTDYRQNLLARKSGDWWTIFNTTTGAKLRLSLEKNPVGLLRSVAPELVDMKITDYCNIGCEFCYQDSTANGEHANLRTIKRYLDELSANGVFEVALGGGEPTLHPDFPAILKYARNQGIVPNFTSKKSPASWSPGVLQAVRDYAGSFAYSVQDARGVLHLDAAQSLYGLDGVVHFVVGAYYDEYLKEVIRACKEHYISLTLLGFKSVGRGAEYKKVKQEITPELLKSANRLSVDTAFVAEYKQILIDADIPSVLVVEGEGRFSMYIDAVNKQAGISSYHLSNLVDYEPSGWDLGKLPDVWNRLG